MSHRLYEDDGEGTLTGRDSFSMSDFAHRMLKDITENISRDIARKDACQDDRYARGMIIKLEADKGHTDISFVGKATHIETGEEIIAEKCKNYVTAKIALETAIAMSIFEQEAKNSK